VRNVALVMLGTLAIVALPLAEAQPPKVARIGVLTNVDSPLLQTFRDALHELGYVEGRTVAFDYRFSRGMVERLPELAGELIRSKVDVIFAPSTTAARAASKATATIPIVFASAGDPVETGLVASLARPGGNITGLSSVNVELAGKRLALLKEAVPGIARVAILWVDAPIGRAQMRETEVAARALGLQLQSLPVRTADELEAALKAAVARGAEALVVPRNPLSFGLRARIPELAASSRLPAVYDDIEFAEAGGLMTYGPSLRENYRRAAVYIDKILKGSRPADLPVEQPTTFELAINLKAAGALGITIPQSLLLRADHVFR